jgi:Domain of unknown function (DUF6458)
MGIGAGLFLIAVGAILRFAVTVTAKGVNLDTIGVILMIAGVAGVLLDVVIFMPRRRTVTTAAAAPTAQQTYVQ